MMSPPLGSLPGRGCWRRRTRRSPWGRSRRPLVRPALINVTTIHTRNSFLWRELKCGLHWRDTDQNLAGHGNGNTPRPFPIPSIYSLHTCSARQRGEAACAAWGRLVLRSPNPLLSLRMITAAAPRQLTPIYPLPHVDRHLSDSAALVFAY